MHFFGSERDEEGLPSPFYSYQIYASDPGPGGLSAVATIVSLSGESPRHIPLTEGDRRAAMEAARQHLLKKHVGLKSIG